MQTEKIDKLLSIILIITIITALAMVIYVIVTPKKGEEFTEFYILGTGGKAADYPTSLSVGEKGEVIVGVVNHEYEDVSYLFRAEIENRSIGKKRLQLVHNETQEFHFVFTADEIGRKKLEFKLFKDNITNESYRDLHLWIDID